MSEPFEFTAPLYLWDARQADSWVFVQLPTALADDLADLGEQVARGFGSLRVDVQLGATRWRTSLFPSSAARTYVLPVKKAVRRAEGVAVGDLVRVTLRLVDV